MQKEGNKMQISQRMEHFDWLITIQVPRNLRLDTLKFAGGKMASSPADWCKILSELWDLW